MEPTRRFPMVVAVDLSEYAPGVLEYAFDQAARHERADIHVVLVVEHPHDEEDAMDKLESLAREVRGDFTSRPHADWRIRLHVRRGRAAEEIVALAADVEAELLVIGRFGAGGRRHRHPIGLTAERVVWDAPCLVLVTQVEGYEHALSAQQCAACIEVRRTSDGEIWFCQDHSGEWMGTSTLLMTHGSTPLGHGLMW